MFHWDLIQFVASVPGLLLAITIHEYAHALMAVKMGDMTPKFAGRFFCYCFNLVGLRAFLLMGVILKITTKGKYLFL